MRYVRRGGGRLKNSTEHIPRAGAVCNAFFTFCFGIVGSGLRLLRRGWGEACQPCGVLSL